MHIYAWFVNLHEILFNFLCRINEPLKRQTDDNFVSSFSFLSIYICHILSFDIRRLISTSNLIIKYNLRKINLVLLLIFF